jgi:hypothetical protein
MVILATAGQRHEALMLRKLMEAGAVKRTGRGRPRIRPAAVAGDKGYSHLSLRRYLRRRGIRAVIPPKSDQPPQPSFDKAAYRQRNHVEIVCTQVTKPRLGAAWGGRDHVADLHLAVGDHDPVDQQLHQLAALLEAGQAQTHGQLLQHPSHGLGDAADLDQPLTLGGDLPLAGQQVGLPPGKGPVLALEGGQVDHLGQVGLQQPLPLAGHAGPYAV